MVFHQGFPFGQGLLRVVETGKQHHATVESCLLVRGVDLQHLAENIQGVSEAINIIKDMVDNSNTLNQKGLHTVEGLRIKSKQRDEASD